MKYFVVIFTFIVLLNVRHIECGWGGSRSNVTQIGTNVGRDVYTKYSNVPIQSENNVVTPDAKLDTLQRRGLGFSAWGIIGIIIGGILTIMGIYYTSVFYPILCKKERCYDKMGVISNV